MSYKSNIWKYNIYVFLDMFILFGAFLKVYYLDINLSIFQIMLLSSIAWFSTFLFEIPSGIISDLYGRKKTLIISNIFYILWIFFLFLSNNYIILLFSAIFAGLKSSFVSGTGDAFLYDSLKAIKKEDDFSKIIGKSHSYFLLGRAISSILGSIIAYFTTIKFTIFLTIIIAIFSLLIVLSFKETPIYKEKKKKNEFLLHFKDSIKIILNNKQLLFLIIIFSLITTLVKITFNFSQIFLSEYNINIIFYGIIFSIFMMLATFGSRIYSKIPIDFNNRKYILFFVIIFPILILFLGILKNIIIFFIIFIIFEILFGFLGPLKKHLLNEQIKSHRATIISNVSLITSLFIAFFEPLIGYIADKQNVFNTFIYFGVGSMILLLIIFIFFYLNNK
jgi:MFS family permease